ncbi:MAG: hypothetical protein HYY96_14830 [Candidatus Tectomicrobia bacterium]|nr:hypothetical protein [Candidatus Tectomicrobia bacterium]
MQLPPAADQRSARDGAPLRARQLLKLRRQLLYLQNHSPVYRPLLERAGLSWRTLDDVEELRRLPLTTFEDLRARQLAAPSPDAAASGVSIAAVPTPLPTGDLTTCPAERVRRIYPAPLPAGGSCFFGVSDRDLSLWVRLAREALLDRGMRQGERVLHLALSRHAALDAALLALEEIGAVGILANLEEMSSLVEEGRLDAVCAPVSCAMQVEEALRSCEVKRGGARLARYYVGDLGDPAAWPGEDEPWGSKERRDQAAKRADTAGHAGAALLVGVPGIAPVLLASCPNHAGFHEDAGEYCFSEIINPESGEALPWQDGSRGELVLTPLERECTPLLRLRTGVVVQLHTGPCACGRSSVRLAPADVS